MAVTFHLDSGGFIPSGRRAISAWVRSAIKEEGRTAGDIAFVFCSSQRQRQVNVQYLGHDWDTDVITFDYGEETGLISGDIFIDPETVRDNARQFGMPFEQEILRVMIHGVLHLCGYGDKTEGEEKKMREMEDHYLAKYPS